MHNKKTKMNRMLYVWKIPSFPILFLTNFIFGLSMSFFAPFSSLFGLDEVGMSNIGFGIFMTIMSIGGVIFSTYIAKLSDWKLSRKKLLLITTIAAILGYTGFAVFRNYISLSIVAFFLLGIAAASTPQLWAFAREILKQSNTPEKEAPFVMNVFRMFFALSWTVGPALAAWILVIVDFKGLFLLVALGYVLALISIFFLKDVPKEKATREKPVVLRKFIFKPHIFAYISAVLFITISTTINMLNIPQFITKILHGTEMHVGVAFSVPPVFEVPFMIIFGILATKVNNGLLIRIGFLIATVYFGLLLFVTAPWQIYLLQILSAGQVAILSGIAITYFQNFIPNEPGTATTLYMNTQQIGSTLGYLLFGLLSEMISYQHVFIICFVLTGLGLIVLLLFGKEKANYFASNDIKLSKNL